MKTLLCFAGQPVLLLERVCTTPLQINCSRRPSHRAVSEQDVRGVVQGARLVPPGYKDADNAKRKYPTLHLLDGQTAFDECTAFHGEYELQIDEAVTKLIGECRMMQRTPVLEEFR